MSLTDIFHLKHEWKHFSHNKGKPSITHILKHERKLVVIYLALEVNCKLIPIRKRLICRAPGRHGHSRYATSYSVTVCLGKICSKKCDSRFRFGTLSSYIPFLDFQSAYSVQIIVKVKDENR